MASGYGSYTNNAPVYNPQFKGSIAAGGSKNQAEFMGDFVSGGIGGFDPRRGVEGNIDAFFNNDLTKGGGMVINKMLDNDLLNGAMSGISNLLGGKTVVNQYATKTGEQMDYANAALQSGQYGLSQLSRLGSGIQNVYGGMSPWQQQYQQQYINPMMSAVNSQMRHTGSQPLNSSANNLMRQRAMMDIGKEMASRVGQERQMQMQGGLAGQQTQLSALGQITGASNNALNQSFFDTKVGKEGGIGGIVGSVIGAII